MLRKITSLTSFLSAVITLVTSVVLYIVPHGRVANWADWTFWGLSKDDWAATHTTVGTLFLLALVFHTWLNWKPIMAYMKNKARELVIFTPAMVISVALTLFVFAGTLMGLPPMQQLLDFGEEIKVSAVETYGNPPYGHAEDSSLKKFCGYLGFDVNKAIAALEAKGYTLTDGQKSVIKVIGRSKGVSPQQVFDDIRDSLGVDPFSTLPPQPPEGLGKIKLADICKTFGLPADEAIARLAAKSIKAEIHQSMKDIAKAQGLNPRDVYTALRGE
jgi:hypothetical protein